MFRRVSLVLAMSAVALLPTLSHAQGTAKVSSPLEFSLKNIDGKDVKLSDYKGKVVLLVNVASKCGLTPQYKALQSLYDDFGKDGLVIIGVPANNFGKQEPGTNDEIKTFCETKYKVTFPMMAKVSVKGADIDPLYQWLTSKETNPKFAGDISWNFEKFLIGRDGQIITRITPRTDPSTAEFKGQIQKALAQ